MTPSPFARDSTHLVMDVGGSHVTAARVDLSSAAPRILERRDVELDSQASGAVILRTILSAAAGLSDGGEAWTVAMPGPFDYENGHGRFEGIGKFDGIAGVDLRGELADGLRADRDDVRFVNDAAAYGIGEWAFGQPGDRPRRLVCLTLGTGVGSVFLDGGAPVTSGPDVPRDGFAHTIDYRGRPLEETVSTRAIRRAYRAASRLDVDVAEIARRARAGDAAAAAAFGDTMRALGRAVGPWVGRFGASRLVVGGAMSRSWDLLAQPLRAGLSETIDLSEVQVTTSTLGDDAPLAGAAVWSLGLDA